VRGGQRKSTSDSTPDIGLGFVVSIKTTHFRDRKNRKGKITFGDFNHNETRFDAEFRAEAAEIHERNPFGVLIGLFVLPEESAMIFTRGRPSSFAKWVKRLRFRAGREKPDDRNELFERIFIGLYKQDTQRAGEIHFFDVMNQPPVTGLPREDLLTLSGLISEITRQFQQRNDPPFHFGVSTLAEDEGIPISQSDIVEPEEDNC